MDVGIRISGDIEFTSNSHKDIGCHIILATLANENGDIVVSAANSCWLFAKAIKPKTSSDIVLPDNTPPYIYSLNANLTFDFCLFTGCPYYIRIVVIPCCRTDINVDQLTFSDDPDNPKYLSAPVPPSICKLSNITTGGFDGYYIVDIPLKDKQFYRCNRYMVNQRFQTRIRDIVKATSGSVKDGISYYPCPLNKTSPPTTMSLFTVPYALPVHVLDKEIGIFKDTYFCFQDIFASDYLTSVNDKDCCNSCNTYTASYTDNEWGNLTAFIIYQDCNDGMLKAILNNNIPINTTTNISVPCSVKGSVFGVVYNSSVAYYMNIIEGSSCRNCDNFLNQT